MAGERAAEAVRLFAAARRCQTLGSPVGEVDLPAPDRRSDRPCGATRAMPQRGRRAPRWTSRRPSRPRSPSRRPPHPRNGGMPPSPPPDGEPLTRREREVARLLARGDSDRQIAETLSISAKTVGVHVHHILQKLDLYSRAQVAERLHARHPD